MKNLLLIFSILLLSVTLGMENKYKKSNTSKLLNNPIDFEIIPQETQIEKENFLNEQQQNLHQYNDKEKQIKDLSYYTPAHDVLQGQENGFNNFDITPEHNHTIEQNKSDKPKIQINENFQDFNNAISFINNHGEHSLHDPNEPFTFESFVIMPFLFSLLKYLAFFFLRSHFLLSILFEYMCFVCYFFFFCFFLRIMH